MGQYSLTLAEMLAVMINVKPSHSDARHWWIIEVTAYVITVCNPYSQLASRESSLTGRSALICCNPDLSVYKIEEIRLYDYLNNEA